MFFYPLRYRIYANGKDANANGHGNWKVDGETEMEMELRWKAKWKWKTKKRGEMADKNGKVNEKSKWKNW